MESHPWTLQDVSSFPFGIRPLVADLESDLHMLRRTLRRSEHSESPGLWA